MAPNSIPHFCGGILFCLLLEARKPRTKARNKLNGGSDGLTAPDVYAGLIQVVMADRYLGKSTLEKCASDYKKCESSKGSYVPFTEASTISSYHSAVLRKDPALIERITEFISTYLSSGKYEWLVRALIDLIQSDKGITWDPEIAINYSEQKKISELDSVNDIVLQPFLISIIDLMLQYSPDSESGRPTFESWYTQSSPKAEWKFRKDNTIGDRIHPINVILDIADSTTPQTSDCEIVDDIDDSFIGIQDQSDDEVILEPMKNALSILADALTVQKQQLADQIRENKYKNSDEQLFEEFKTDSEDLLRYCIEKDVSGEPIRLSLPDEISELITKWKYDLRKIYDSEKRGIIVSTIKTLSAYSIFLSTKYLRLNENCGMLVFRNSTPEEGLQLTEDLRPNSLKLRKKLKELYTKLWPLPESDNDSETNKGENVTNDEPSHNSIHQTVVNQYGDHSIMINHVDNLKL